MFRNADETHALAQRKVAQMDKLRTVFGFSQDQDNKEGEAFDRELQERRKRDRQMEIEQREKAKVKKAREAEKEKKRKEKERKRSLKKAEKDKKKQEKQRQKVTNHTVFWSWHYACSVIVCHFACSFCHSPCDEIPGIDMPGNDRLFCESHRRHCSLIVCCTSPVTTMYLHFHAPLFWAEEAWIAKDACQVAWHCDTMEEVA